MSHKLTIYYTSDTHGMMFPSQEADGAPSLLQAIHDFDKDGDTLVLDGGDTIQGSMLTSLLWEQDSFAQVIPAVFAAGGYDYYTLGNHDFNNGYSGLLCFTQAMQATCVVANVLDSTARLPIRPYVIHTTENGLRVGITGIVTPFVNLWESPANLENLTVTDPYEAASRVLDEMKPLVDLTICLYHGGYEDDLDTGETLLVDSENCGCRICRDLGFDLLLTAHQHCETSGRQLGNSYTLQPPPNVTKYAKLVVQGGAGNWQISSELIAPKPECDHGLLHSFAPVQATLSQWAATAVGTLDEEVPVLSKLESATHGSPLADLCNMVQLAATGADISCTGLGNKPMGLPKNVTIGDIYTVYPFANTITVLEVTAEVLLEALERCAAYFDADDSGNAVISDRFLRPKVEHYNHDFWAGVDYCVDLASPVGSRVHSVTVGGKPLGTGSYTLALSNYRATGTGGYGCYTDCRVVSQLDSDLRTVICDYIRRSPELVVPSLGKVSFGSH